MRSPAPRGRKFFLPKRSVTKSYIALFFDPRRPPLGEWQRTYFAFSGRGRCNRRNRRSISHSLPLRGEKKLRHQHARTLFSLDFWADGNLIIHQPRSDTPRKRAERRKPPAEREDGRGCTRDKRTGPPVAASAVAMTAMATRRRRRRSAARSGLTRRPAAPCHGPASGATPLPRAWLLLLVLLLLLLLLLLQHLHA